jgi:phage tail protein X
MASLIYTTVDGDRWDNLAWKFYGDPTLISLILMANCGMRVPFEAELEAGIRLMIPLLQQPAVQANDVPPWQQAGPQL